MAGEIPTAAMFNSNLRDFGRGFADAWTSYTPALTASATNPTGWTNTGYYLRVGKLLIAKFKLVAGASMTAGSGTYYIGLPSGMTAATTVDFAECGTVSLVDASPTPVTIGKFTLQQDDTNNRLRIQYTTAYPTGNNVLVANDKPWTWAANDAIRGFAVLEIQ